MKKKGSALILTLCVITLLSALTIILVTESTEAYKYTMTNEKKDKLNLMAESGIEKGLSALKQKIYNTPEIFDSNISLECEPFSFTEDNIKISVELNYIEQYNDKDISNVPCIKIISKAVNTKSNAKKTINAYILKSDISNIYYETIFGNVITTLDDVKENTSKSFDIKNSLNDLTLDGTMYLQGGEINIKPYKFNYISGGININGNRLVTNNNDNALIDKMSVNPTINMDKQIEDKVKKLTPNLLSILKIKYNTPADAGLSDFYVEGCRYINDNPDYIVKACKQTTKGSSGNESEETTLVTFKITKETQGAMTPEFNWSKFVGDVKDYIMRNMIKIDGHSFTGNPNGNNYGDAFEKAYKGMYKLYIIDGDVVVETPKNTTSYINHVIYSIGKCTLAKGDNPNIIFNNCSIMAKKIIISDLRTFHGVHSIELYGIKKPDVKPAYGDLSPFSAGNRASINKFLIQHLDGYADSLRFKVYKWEEKN